MTPHRPLIVATSLCFVIALSQAQTNGLCFTYNVQKKYCGSCYESKVDTVTEECGPQVPSTDNCLIYTKFPRHNGVDLCVVCKKGYAASIKSGKVLPSCQADSNYIKNCFIEGEIGGIRRCSACVGGVPSSDGRSCIPWSQLKQPILDCKIGAGSASGQFSCIICQNSKTWNFETQSCEVISSLVGCLNAKKSAQGVLTCGSCDVFNGYSMNGTGKCAKGV